MPPNGPDELRHFAQPHKHHRPKRIYHKSRAYHTQIKTGTSTPAARDVRNDDCTMDHSCPFLDPAQHNCTDHRQYTQHTSTTISHTSIHFRKLCRQHPKKIQPPFPPITYHHYFPCHYNVHYRYVPYFFQIHSLSLSDVSVPTRFSLSYVVTCNTCVTLLLLNIFCSFLLLLFAHQKLSPTQFFPFPIPQVMEPTFGSNTNR